MATREELEEVLSDLCPNYKIRKDRNGRLIIHTNLLEDEFGDLHDNEDDVADDDDEDDLDLVSDDEDLLPLDDDEDEDEEV